VVLVDHGPADAAVRRLLAEEEEIERRTREIDEAYISSARPEVIFLDGDYVSEGLGNGIRRIWEARPAA